ncbi:MAG: hypothetical protein GY861_19180 [bacterium]|nr:hypothetical protein [bacterium]
MGWKKRLKAERIEPIEDRLDEIEERLDALEDVQVAQKPEAPTSLQKTVDGTVMKEEKNANEVKSTTSVSTRKQAKGCKGVRVKDSKGKAPAKESEEE